MPPKRSKKTQKDSDDEPKDPQMDAKERRKQQNRLAQQALRQRRNALVEALEQHIRDLEHTSNVNVQGMKGEIDWLRQMLAGVTAEMASLMTRVQADPSWSFPSFSLLRQGLPHSFQVQKAPPMPDVPHPQKRRKVDSDDESSHDSVEPHEIRRNLTPQTQLIHQFPTVSLNDPIPPIVMDQSFLNNGIPPQPEVVFSAMAQKLFDQHNISLEDQHHVEAAMSLANVASPKDVYLPANHPSPLYKQQLEPLKDEGTTPSAYLNLGQTPQEELFATYETPAPLAFTPHVMSPLNVQSPKLDDHLTPFVTMEAKTVTPPDCSPMLVSPTQSTPPHHPTPPNHPTHPTPPNNASPNYTSPSHLASPTATSPGSTPSDTSGLPPKLARCIDSLPTEEMKAKIFLLKSLNVIDVDYLCEQLRKNARCHGPPRELSSWSVPKDFFVQFPQLRIPGLNERE